jgi:integrase
MGAPSRRQKNDKVRRPPRRRKNGEVRPREHLTPQEVAKLVEAASHEGRYGFRDALMIRMAYVHGLRARELIGLLWSDVDFDDGNLFIRRVKRGKPAVHPLTPDVVRSLKKLSKDRQGFVFTSERDTPLSVNGFGKIVARAGEKLELGFRVHPHMLRHSCGYKLVNDGEDTRGIQGYLGHANIKDTVRYTTLGPNRFKNFWTD